MTSDKRYRLAPAFVARQFPRRYDYTVEECVAAGLVLTIAEAMASLEGPKRRHLTRWRWSEDPSFELVAAKAGRCRRWWFRCPSPSCHRKCEALYRPPDAEDWACRTCSRVQYGSRRYGRRHLAREIRTPRQEVIVRRRYERECRLVKALAMTKPWWREGRDALLDRMAQVVATNERESERAAAWLREQLRRPRRVAAASPEIMRSLTPELLATLQRLNAVTA